MSEELVAQGQTALSTELADLFVEDSGLGGLESMGGGDFALPFLTILQKGSPQVSRANAKYIKGADAGKIYNNVTGAVYDGEKGIYYVPCGFSSAIVEWTPRDSGGGLVGHHDRTSQVVRAARVDPRTKRLVAANGNLLIDTAYHFGIYWVEGQDQPGFAVIGMASTQKRVSRQWNTKMASLRGTHNGKSFQYPCYSHVYLLTTKGEQKDDYDWFGWKLGEPELIKDQNLYLMAREFAKQVAAGDIRVSAQSLDDAGGGENGSGSNDRSDVPF